jgi:hypothetical protein
MILRTPPAPATPRRRSLLARLGLASWRGRFAWLAGLLFTFLLVCWILARLTPAWYLPLDPADDGVQRTAGEAENHLRFDLHTALERLPLGEQRWTITEDEVNALLAVKTNLTQGPITDPCVTFTRGQITISARAKKLPGGDPNGGIGSVRFSVGVVGNGSDPGGQGLVKVTGVWAGDLPLPKSIVENALRAQVPAIVDAVRQSLQMQFNPRDIDKAAPIYENIIRSIANGQPFPLRYKWDSREFVVRDLLVEKGSLTIVMAQIKPAPTPPPPATATRP